MRETKLLEVINLKKYFNVGKNQTLKAVDDVSFTIEKGHTMGLVGESGCGKTTVGRTIIRLYDANAGKVLLNGVDVHKTNRKQYKQMTKQMQMIYQDPYASLNPRMTVGDIVAEGLDIHGMYQTKKERQDRTLELLSMVGLNREHAGRFPHEFSGGQRQRAGIARALAVEPQFLICDEAISALDVSIQAQVINLLMDLQENLGLTFLFIAHDLSMVRHISDEVAVMYLGNIVEKACTGEIFMNPTHPYTMGLLDAVPTADPNHEHSRKRQLLTGDVKYPINPKPGCRFYQRCKQAMPVCDQQNPTLKDLGGGHFVACHLY